jgi:Fe-S-cluster containining protein
MTDCNSCGVCCDPVVLPASPQRLFSPDGERAFGAETVAWMREHWTPIKPRRNGLARVMSWNDGFSEQAGPEGLELVLAWFYDCDQFDPETRQCRDYEGRPDVCREYPWYKGVRPDAKLPPTCSYRTDIGQPVETMIEFRARGTTRVL